MASVDYYNGRTLEEIVVGEEEWQWSLKLAEGAVIKNWDRRRTAVPEIPKGMGLLMTIFSEDSTELVFGVTNSTETQEFGRVAFTPTQYSISDPIYQAEEIFPQKQDEFVAEDPTVVYPAELLDREQTGPENRKDDKIVEPSEVEDTEGSKGTADENDERASSEGN